MVVLDTCALIELDKKKPSFSLSVLKQMDIGSYILSISFAEIACKIKLGKLEMAGSPKILYHKLRDIENVAIIDIGAEEWLDSIDLNWKDNKDPADRVITAFAAKKNLTIITSDEKIKTFYKKVSW